MFTTNHFIWMAICLVIIGLLTFLSIKFKFSLKTASFIMAGVAISSELLKIFTHMEPVANGGTGMVIEPTALPLHICSMYIFVFLWLPFSKDSKFRRFVLNLAVPISLVGGGLSILMATSGVNFARPFAYQCFIYHAVMVWFGAYLIYSKNCDLGVKSWITNCIAMTCIAIVMIWVNGALSAYNTNFLYVVRPPKSGLPFLNLNSGWFVYFLRLCFIGLVAITLVHLPAMIKQLVSKSKCKVCKNCANAGDNLPEKAEPTDEADISLDNNQSKSKK